MSATVQLVFRGEVLAGFQAEDVQRELGRLLRADEGQLKALFSGRRAVLKRGLAAQDAARYVGRLAAIGAQVHVEPEAADAWPTISPPPEDEPPPVAPPRQAAPPRPAPVPLPLPVPALVPAAPPASRPMDLALVPSGDGPDEVVCPKCGERQTRRLLCGNCATNIEMALAALKEEADQRRAERQAALDARRDSRRRGPAPAASGERSAWPIGFGFSGRVGRLSSATANLWLLAALLLLTTGFLKVPTLPRMLLLGVGVLAVFFFSMRLTVLRCHDCGRHGWWALFVLVPYAGSVASLLISFLPGEPDDNDYGPPPPKGGWPAFGLAALVLLGAGAMTASAGLKFLERSAEAEQQQEAEEGLVQFDGSAGVGGSSDQAGLQDAWRAYLQAPGHKAFAVSSAQAYAWVGQAASPDEAARSAHAQCESRRAAYTEGCRVVSVNGQQAGR